jgi:hypothetical protein
MVVVAVVVRRASAQVGGFAFNSHSLMVFRSCRDVKKPAPPPFLRTAFINISINSNNNSKSALFVFLPR